MEDYNLSWRLVVLLLRKRVILKICVEAFSSMIWPLTLDFWGKHPNILNPPKQHRGTGWYCTKRHHKNLQETVWAWFYIQSIHFWVMALLWFANQLFWVPCNSRVHYQHQSTDNAFYFLKGTIMVLVWCNSVLVKFSSQAAAFLCGH